MCIRRKRKTICCHLKKKIIARDKGICQICFLPINMNRLREWKRGCRIPAVEYRFDHILRSRDGGLETFENLRLTHHVCNYKRG